MGALLCLCTRCNAREMVDSACEIATVPQGEEGNHLEMAVVKMCLFGVCICIPSVLYVLLI